MSAGPRAITPIKRRLIEAAVAIQEEPPDQISYLHSVLAMVGMPRREMVEREFTRQNGHVSLSLEAGSLFDGKALVKQPLPYGARPRLVMIHISSAAVKQRSPVVEVGKSAYEFMRDLGFDTNGESYRQTRKQLLALAACRMTLGYMAGDIPRTISTSPIRRFDAWLQREDGHTTIWPGVLELSRDYYETLLEHAVPLDHEALSALKHSALALDVYSWLAHRLCRLSKPLKLSWHSLLDQFGQEYRSIDNFRAKMQIALRQVLVVYPDAKFEIVRGGIVLKPSHPPITKLLVQARLSEALP
jgi:hypothetical protein